MRRVVRAGRCRCGNRVGSIEERPARSCAGLALNKLEDKLETPSGEQPEVARRVGVATVTVPLDIME